MAIWLGTNTSVVFFQEFTSIFHFFSLSITEFEKKLECLSEIGLLEVAVSLTIENTRCSLYNEESLR